MPDSKRFFTSVSVVLILILVSILAIINIPEGPIQTATAVSGNISTDTTWSGNVDIDGNVVVDPGVVLTVDGGTNITFQDVYLLIIEGIIKANGTQGNPINITSRLGAHPFQGRRYGLDSERHH